MTKETHDLNWLVCDAARTKATIKYQLNHLKQQLHVLISDVSRLKKHFSDAKCLCEAIANKYLEYLQIQGEVELNERSPAVEIFSSGHFVSILSIEQQLQQTFQSDMRNDLIKKLISLYRQANSIDFFTLESQANQYAKHLKQLFNPNTRDKWLLGLIDFWNQHEKTGIDLGIIFQHWSISQQQAVLAFFTNPNFIELVSAIFFYKIYPEKLFSTITPPEKLVSVRMRLGVLYYYIELMQQQLYSVALQSGLRPGIDHLLHGDDLPHGITLDINEGYKEVIQIAIKKLKINFSLQNKKHENLDLIYDLKKAYKFWFSPHRLIDTVMLLRRNLIPEQATSMEFKQEMLGLLAQLPTSDCLDLYGYFANNDSRYLLFTFFFIKEGGAFDWLPTLNSLEQKIIHDIFDALCSVMDSLRVELKNRRIITKPYAYKQVKQNVQIGHRNRDAVLRVLAIYGIQSIYMDDEEIEQLFRIVEESA